MARGGCPLLLLSRIATASCCWRRCSWLPRPPRALAPYVLLEAVWQRYRYRPTIHACHLISTGCVALSTGCVALMHRGLSPNMTHLQVWLRQRHGPWAEVGCPYLPAICFQLLHALLAAAELEHIQPLRRSTSDACLCPALQHCRCERPVDWLLRAGTSSTTILMVSWVPELHLFNCSSFCIGFCVG
jgi:hypothetical protein